MFQLLPAPMGAEVPKGSLITSWPSESSTQRNLSSMRIRRPVGCASGDVSLGLKRTRNG